MEKEFVPYDRALRLKEIGFYCDCFGDYFKFGNQDSFLVTDEDRYRIEEDNEGEDILRVPAPTFSQAFRWFRENHSLHAEITWSPSYEYEPGEWADAIYEITITNVSYTKEWVAESPSMQRANGKQLTYEEAELACLDKLIEIVESKSE